MCIIAILSKCINTTKHELTTIIGDIILYFARLQDAELQLKSGSFPSHNPDPRKSISQPSGLTINGIAEKYNMLEEQVKNRIIRAVDQYVRVAPDGRKFGFLCSTMEVLPVQ